MNRRSKFTNLFAEPDSEETPQPEPTVAVEAPKARDVPQPLQEEGGERPMVAAAPINGRKKLGRPAVGKSSDPNYTQVTAYISRQTHREVKTALFQDNREREFSDLVDELLKKWLKDRQ